MYVRLAFAVAAHLEPEILIVDEVLAVGDVQFSKKVLGENGRSGECWENYFAGLSQYANYIESQR